MRTIRLAVVGTGIAARDLHWPALRQLKKQYQVVAVTNRTRAKAEEFADHIGLARSHVHGSLPELLAREEINAVALIVPPQFNRSLVEVALEAGKPVIAEKPIANTLDDARAIADLSRRHGLPVLIAENFRYDDFLAQVKALLDAGGIGELFLVTWRFISASDPGNKYANTGWRQAPQHPGGFLGDVNVHTVDGLRYLAGEIERVHCLAADVRPWLGGYDTAIFNFQFVSGTAASLAFGISAATQQPMLMSLYGTEGTIDATWDRVTLRRPGQEDRVHKIAGPGSYVRDYEDFYRVLALGQTPKMTLEDATRDLAVVLAAVESAETGAAVDVDA